MNLLESLKTLYALLAVVPFVPFALVYGISRWLTGDSKKAFRQAMDVTTVLLIGCVAVLFNRIFSNSFGLYGILLLMLLGGGLLGNMQYRKRGRIESGKLFRAVWRTGFFVMGVMYILLMTAGITQHMFRL
ncbi:DUF3397 domain-containing protein [Paenibacillus pasadenensis]|uniref:DUF3397 domain-containing protein n=1 Tax=Paenibacillus pasadenensis TaxID=217090 RepID=UPI00203C0814|nr:DUF3397 domain-containing protein [Paenibacillus pasadenensis]MCM3746328.1 DUF3397 domain-containing protein [Paenibacillus pasadenensis]